MRRVARVADIIRRARESPATVRFRDLVKVCDAYFGSPRQAGTSHQVYRTPRPGDPRVNIQNDNGMAKAYQVPQVLRAVEKLEAAE